MDKNMINIDDLIKQRLTGGEEREIPGSWSRMRDLLDKEMPEKRRVAGYYNWRRMFGVMSGLVLLSVLTVGGYNAVQSYRMGNSHEEAIAAANTSTRMHAAPSVARTTVAGETGRGAVITDKAASRLSRHEADTYTGSSRKHDKPNTAAAIPSSDKAASAQANVLSTSSALNTADLRPETDPHVVAGITAEQKINPIQHKSAGATIAATPVAKAALSAPKALNLISPDKPSPGSAFTQPSSDLPAAGSNMAATNGSEHGENNAEVSLQPMSNLGGSATADNTRLATVPAPVQPTRPKDTLNKVQVVQRQVINPLTQVSRITLDTIATERFAVDKVQPATTGLSGSMTPAAPLVVPGASASVAAADAAISSESLVPLSNFKVQSRKTSRWNARSFDEVVRDVKFNLAQTKFYPGISAGGNSYMFGPNNLGGFQLGLFGLFTFGETWSAMGELKYMHRFNSGATLKDDYTDVQQRNNGYFQANVEHFFSFTTLQSIEMPLALRYAAGRLNLFGGLNMAYHFGVDVDEQTLHPADTTFTPFSGTPGKIKADPLVSYNDFRARFALGGLLGISFEVSPSVQLDFRATKNLWDNAYGLGAEQVSRQLYNAPSMQFSLFYRFNQKNQIPRAK